jgi:hypothetical protein
MLVRRKTIGPLTTRFYLSWSRSGGRVDPAILSVTGLHRPDVRRVHEAVDAPDSRVVRDPATRHRAQYGAKVRTSSSDRIGRSGQRAGRKRIPCGHPGTSSKD